MFKKVISLLISSNLSLYAVTPVSDTNAYYYMISNINQTTQLINSATEQIATLGGIRTVMDDVKSDINDAKSSLEGSLQALENARENFQDTITNVEIKSLFDLDSERTTVSGRGIAYDDLAKVFTDSFKKADDGLIKMFGGEAALSKYLSNRHKLIKALNTNNLSDFSRVMNESLDVEEVKRDILISDYISKTKKLDTESKQSISAQLINNEWQSTFFPTTEKQLEAQEKKQERMKELSEFIQKSKDMRQSIKTTNMLLMELLQLAQKDFNSALNYRNAMTGMYLRNGKGSALAVELKRRQEELAKAANTLPKSIRNSHVSKMSGSSPFGIGWRPLSK